MNFANINCSLTGCAEMVEQARDVCSHFAQTEQLLYISAQLNSNVKRTMWTISLPGRVLNRLATCHLASRTHSILFNVCTNLNKEI